MSPNLPPPSTRERILAYLQENRAATIGGLSRLWGLTRADIRYHLSTLVEEGLVEIIPREAGQPAGRGRPTQSYRLTLHSTLDNLPDLCAAALDLLLTPDTPEEMREAVLRGLAGRLCGSLNLTANPTQRFNQAVAFLNQHAYRARWEAGASGPRVLLRNCPYAAILPAHPELCMLDRCLLEHLLQIPLVQSARMNLSSGKPPACVFTV